MKNHALLLLFITIFGSCAHEEELAPIEPTEPDQTVDIIDISAKINSPIQTRDYSFSNQGVNGIFEDPEVKKLFQGSIHVNYSNNSSDLSNTDIEIVWRSNIDGILFKGTPNNYFESDLHENLSTGLHTIYFEASINGKDIISKDSIMLSNNIKLTANNTSKAVKLNWTKYNGDDFVSYQIFSEDFTPISEIHDINTLEYDYKDFASLTEDKNYQIVVKTEVPKDHIIGSNIESMHPGEFIEFPYYLRKIIKDPIRPRLYALVGHRNYSASDYGLVVIDKTDETFEISSHILKEDFFTDFVISQNASHLFLSQIGSDKITKLDLSNLENTTFTTHTDGWGIEKIEIAMNNTLLCYSNSPAMNGSKFTIYDGNSGTKLIGPIVNPITFNGIKFSFLNNAIYGGKSGSNSGQLYKYSISNNLLTLNTTPISTSLVTNQTHELFLTQDTQHIFWENHQLDLNLNITRTFDAPVKACSPANTFLADLNRVFDYHGAFTIFEFPNFPETNSNVTSSLVFPNESNIVYCRASQSNVINNGEEYYPANTQIFNFKIGKSDVY
ncbi:hypothetical protein SAMN04489761_3796 [Tenacibaculum sp. MAR_2009_124]|uniref:hypothetical protein n=1 Tax=Tenacibaculum sp. MAR_2009_124 TaxID=1250059 RepID=UPI00089473A2|nr:hypothetical protein [Tenacibaculum sp. MAR_2009_124]SEC86047.1 hypothetical protein SAMN04489761_3796 [Tenacibaculum sp. MAR_2009_124]